MYNYRPTFETNSSSAHGAFVKKQDHWISRDENPFEKYLKTELLKDGTLLLKHEGLLVFGRGTKFKILHTPLMKMCYAIASLCGGNWDDTGTGDHLPPREKYWYKSIERAVHSWFPEIKQIKVGYEAGHESLIPTAMIPVDEVLVTYRDGSRYVWYLESANRPEHYYLEDGTHYEILEKGLEGHYYGSVDHQSSGMIEEFLKMHRITVEDLIFNDRYVLYMDTDESSVVDTLLDSGVISTGSGNIESIEMVKTQDPESGITPIWTYNRMSLYDVLRDLNKEESSALKETMRDLRLKDAEPILGWYRNGNYISVIFPDGSRIKSSPDDVLVPEFADSIDLTISYRCDRECVFCYQGCTTTGKHADLFQMDEFVQSLHPFTEIAIGLNDLSHPQLEYFLNALADRKVIVNGTVNILHAIEHHDRIIDLQQQGLLHGIGISCNDHLYTINNVEIIQSFDNPVIHVISGIVTPSTLDRLAHKNLNLLILGYKSTGRGIEFMKTDGLVQERQKDLYKWMDEEIHRDQPRFDSISLDTLAWSEFQDAGILDREGLQKFYSGDDGEFTFFVDAVKGVYAKNSVTADHMPIKGMDAQEMFKRVRESLT